MVHKTKDQLKNLLERTESRDALEEQGLIYNFSKSASYCPLSLSLCVCTESLPLCLTLRPHRLQPPLPPLSMGFSRQEYWSGLPRPPPGYLSDTGMKPKSPVSTALQVDSLPSEPSGKIFPSEKCEIVQVLKKFRDQLK